MLIKAGIWKGLTQKEKMDMLIHFQHYNPLKAVTKKTAHKEQSA